MTERTTCRFTLKEYGEGIPWMLIEEYEPGIGVLKGKSLGLEFRSGISHADGRTVASLLNEKLKGVVLFDL